MPKKFLTVFSSNCIINFYTAASTLSVMIRLSRVVLSQSPAQSTKSLAGKKLGVGKKDAIKRSWKEARQTQFQDLSMKQSLR